MLRGFWSAMYLLLSLFVHHVLSDEETLILIDGNRHKVFRNSNSLITGDQNGELCRGKDGQEIFNGSSPLDLFRLSAETKLFKNEDNEHCGNHVTVSVHSSYSFTDITILHTLLTLNISSTVCFFMNQHQRIETKVTSDNGEKLFTAIYLNDEVVRVVMKLGIDKIHRQTFYLELSKRNCATNSLPAVTPEIFVYTDTTTVLGKDLVYISNTASKTPQIYRLFLDTGNNSLKLIKTLNSTPPLEVTLDASESKIYKVTSELKTYTIEIIIISVTVTILFLCAIPVLIWQKSIPKKKTAAVIYCPCDLHKLSANALRQLLNFFENHCLLSVEEPTLSLSCYMDEQEETKTLVEKNYDAADFVIFVPFPRVENHDRSYEREVHQLCELFKKNSRKIELKLPFDDNNQGWCPTSEWPRGSYEHIQMLEELYKFIRLIHPCYYPYFLERFLRYELWGPRLATILRNNTYTNDHIREITDPKLNIRHNTLSILDSVTMTKHMNIEM